MELFLLWVIFSLLVGFIGSGRNIGFGGAFFVSLVLSPLIGLILTLLTAPKDEEYKRATLRNQEEQTKAVQGLRAGSLTEELQKVSELHDRGVLSAEEYEAAKRKLLT